MTTYSGMNDQQLAEKLGIPADQRKTAEEASQAISTYLDTNCDLNKLKGNSRLGFGEN